MKKKATKRDAREAGRIILAHGEVTGHAHEVVAVATGLPPDGEAAMFVELADGTRELMVLATCELRHQEHGPIALSPDSTKQFRQGDVLLNPIGPGTWQVIRQREQYAPDEWRQVAD